MTDINNRQQTVHGTGAVTVRQRPGLLLMKVLVRSAERTLELGLAKLKEKCEVTSGLLTRLGAVRVEVGEPYFADQDNQNPLAKMQAIAGRALSGRPTADPDSRVGANVGAILTAVWEIASMTAEEVLILVDRLRFEVAGDTSAAEAPEDPLPWATPDEQIRAALSQMRQPMVDDGAPVFLFIAQLGPEQLEKATSEALAHARDVAERAARSVGLRVGPLWMIHVSPIGQHISRPDKLMDRQRCVSLLAGCHYGLREDESVSDDPRSAEFTVAVNVTYHME